MPEKPYAPGRLCCVVKALSEGRRPTTSGEKGGNECELGAVVGDQDEAGDWPNH